MATVHGDQAPYRVAMKGAPEAVICAPAVQLLVVVYVPATNEGDGGAVR